MIDVILHIGRHKTGTSSLQVFLDKNNELLLKHGYIYPKMIYRGNAHHPLGESLKRSVTARMTDDEIKKVTHDYRRKIVRRFLNKGQKLIFSSESLQNCDPKVIREVFNPTRFNVKVVCYFRDQVSYYCSAYNQRVHANIFSTDVTEFYNSGGFNGDYSTFANEWSLYFDQLECRVFDKSQLYKGDLVSDFCHNFLNIDVTKPDDGQSNPSLTRRLITFKIKLNEKLESGNLSIPLNEKQIYRRLSQMCAADKTGKYQLPKKLVDKIQEQYQFENLSFSKKFLNDITLNFPESQKKTSSDYPMTEAEFSEIYTSLIS